MCIETLCKPVFDLTQRFFLTVEISTDVSTLEAHPLAKRQQSDARSPASTKEMAYVYRNSVQSPRGTGAPVPLHQASATAPRRVMQSSRITRTKPRFFSMLFSHPFVRPRWEIPGGFHRALVGPNV
jgi:hypothetical protein